MDKLVSANRHYVLSQLFDQCQDHKLYCDLILLPRFEFEKRSTEPFWAHSCVLAATLGDEFLEHVQPAAHSEMQHDKRDFLIVEPGFEYIFDFIYNGEFFAGTACTNHNEIRVQNCINQMIKNDAARIWLTEALQSEVSIKMSEDAPDVITEEEGEPRAGEEYSENIIQETGKVPMAKARLPSLTLKPQAKEVGVVVQRTNELQTTEVYTEAQKEDGFDEEYVPEDTNPDEQDVEYLPTPTKKKKSSSQKMEEKEFIGSCCKMNFKLYFPLSVHILRKHSVPMAKCNTCSELMNIEALYQHYSQCYVNHVEKVEMSVALTREIECPGCSETMTLGNYRDHIQEKAELVQNCEVRLLHTMQCCLLFQCILCSTSQSDEAGYRPCKLSSYMRLHAKRYHSLNPPGYKSEMCSICGMQVKQLARHMQTQHIKKESLKEGKVEMVKCDICNKMLRKSRFKIHRRGHFEKYPCQYCKKVFNRRENRTVHERIHSGNRPYICDECGCSYYQFVQLKNHYKCHQLKIKTLPDSDVANEITLTSVDS